MPKRFFQHDARQVCGGIFWGSGTGCDSFSTNRGLDQWESKTHSTGGELGHRLDECQAPPDRERKNSPPAEGWQAKPDGVVGLRMRKLQQHYQETTPPWRAPLHRRGMERCLIWSWGARFLATSIQILPPLLSVSRLPPPPVVSLPHDEQTHNNQARFCSKSWAEGYSKSWAEACSKSWAEACSKNFKSRIKSCFNVGRGSAE